jgi:polyhydroxyalkanoate synthase subunit PhaC
MTAPRGEKPLTEPTPNGRRSTATKPRAATPRPKAATPRPRAAAPQSETAAPPSQTPVAQTAVPQADAKPDTRQHEDLAQSATRLTGGLLGGLWSLGQLAVKHQLTLMRDTPAATLELWRIGLGVSKVEPDKRDKRFADPAWRENPMFRRMMQTYLYYGSRVNPYVDSLGIEGTNCERMRFGLVLAREAMAPTNFFMMNPAALKRAWDTAGLSVGRGMANWTGDLVHNHGMPSMVDLRPFKIGENIAASPGAVIHRNEVFELIQYTPQTETVYQRPYLVVPPQVNRYYALDLSSGRSMYEYLLKHGIQAFGISWRNPTRAQRDWDYDTYVQATIDAVDVVRKVSGSPDVNIMGGCLGGMTAALAQAHLAVQGDNRINSVTMLVTLLDIGTEGRMLLFATPQTLALAKLVSEPTGVIDGWQMASMFSWLRPNDLVWNYWVNNYLLGQDPPAFDILAWNADSTRLSSRFHHQLLDMVVGNQLAHPGAMKVLGTPIDISRIACDTYVAAGRTDHIAPWHTCYKITQMVSGHTQFVLCSSGHIQTVVADPKHRGLGYFLNPETPPDPEKWLAGAQLHEGSWWDHYVAWLAERSGEQVPAPKSLGSGEFPAKGPAPGTYVLG